MTAQEYKDIRLGMKLKSYELAKLLGVSNRTIHLRESSKTPIKPEAELAIRSIASKVQGTAD
jgi:DNA-binding XRE family transcriptional regulator